jgi:anti-sigma regulatory factor (Ser/Thr protein kinase)
MAQHALLVEKAIGPLHRALTDRGFLVHPCVDPAEALAWARTQQPDVVLLAAPECPDPLDPTAGLCRALKLQRATNLLPVLLAGGTAAAPPRRLSVEADVALPARPDRRALDYALTRAFALNEERRADGVLSEVRLLVPSTHDHLLEMNEVLRPWLAGCGLNGHQVQQTSLAVREVVANAIEWGHRCQPDRLVSVVCRLDPEKVGVLVRDNGPGFDPGNLPHAARPGDPLTHLSERAARKMREGGFGILLASGMVDHLCYNATGNEAQLLKFLTARAVRRRSVGSHQ